MFRESDIYNLKVEDPCENDPDYVPDKKEIDVSVFINIITSLTDRSIYFKFL